MIHSMTGYGKSVCEHDKTTYTIEIKTINSKQADINVKIPYFLKEKELEIRNLLSNSLKRGKIELYVIQDVTEQEPSMSINKKIVSNYFEQLQQIVKELNIESDENLLSLALNMPDVLNKEVEQLDDELWSHIKKSIKEAIESVNTYRQSEGKILEKDIRSSISLIHKKLNEITPLEKNRIIKTKERLEKNLKEIEANSDINYDKDRLEQEM